MGGLGHQHRILFSSFLSSTYVISLFFMFGVYPLHGLISTYLRAAVGVGCLALLASAGGQNRSQNQGSFRGAPGVDFGVQNGSKIEALRPPAGPQDPLGGGMTAQAVSGPVLELMLVLFWTLRNGENRAPVEARCYFLQKSPHALGSPKSTQK